ncbi:MAG: hypothetical protein U0984_10785, partial [Prosthecobacter sp.]|nr:hypothetical protein [Prosthecobacter sp.]
TSMAGKISAVAPYVVTGTAGDAKGIDRVEVVLNGGDPIIATLGATTMPTAVPFSVPIVPLNGENTLAVTAYDLRGNHTTVTRIFTFARRYELAILRDYPALGSVVLVATPAASASALSPASGNPRRSAILPGTTVKITATPAAKMVFNGWLDAPAGAVVTGDVMTFTMPDEDVEVTARFTGAPFAAIIGATNSFQGLLQPDFSTADSNSTVGLLTGALTASGGFTGKVSIDGVTQPFRAIFYGDTSCVFLVAGKKQNALTFGGRTLTLEYWQDTITAKVTKNGDVSEGQIRRASYSPSFKVPSNLLLPGSTKGYYTMRLPWSPQIPPVNPYPRGDGFMTITLST